MPALSIAVIAAAGMVLVESVLAFLRKVLCQHCLIKGRKIDY